METIKIQGTDDIPSVVLNAENGIFQISGRSMPEDVTAFYEPILDWISELGETYKNKIVFEFKLEYFNTASSKLLLDILMKLEEMHEAGKDVLVKWYFPEDDEDMEEAGQEYADIVEVPIELVSYE
jgi:hypothetical protein